MNHSPADDPGRGPASGTGGRDRPASESMNLETERRTARPELAAWHARFFASPLPELLKERTQLKFRDLRSQCRDVEAAEVRGLVEGAAAASVLASLPALA